MRSAKIPIVATALLLSGCAMIPEYTRPAPPVPDSWQAAETAESAEAVDVPWRQYFVDGRLRSVIEIALAENRDLRAALLAVERAAALHRIQRGELYPGVGVQAYGELYRLPEKMGENGQAETVEQYAVNVGALNWELDLFGRLRSLSAAALEAYLATEQGAVAVRIAIVSNTARAWLALAADQESLRLAEETLLAQRDTLELIARSAESGMVSDLDLRQAESQVETARAEVALFTGQVAVDRHALDLIAGTTVPPELLPDAIVEVTGSDALAPGLRSEVLLRRPDILAAEHELKARNANIGAARAAFFPRITLTAGVGTMSSDLGDLFSSGTRTWSFAPQLLAPIFAGGSLRANLAATKIEREIAVARYEKAIQTAFAEVADGLALRTTIVEQRDAQEALVRALEEVFRLSDARYNAGLDGYLGVLVAQRSLLRARQALVFVRFAEQANLVTLYGALGGGAHDGVDGNDAEDSPDAEFSRSAGGPG